MSAMIDIILVLILFAGAIVGFKRGVIKSAVTFIGAIVVIVLAFSLKNPISKLLYSFLPFFNFAGDFEGLTTLNIIIYEAIAFVLVYVILMAILQILIKITGVFEHILNFTIILGIPSKLLGAVFGFFEAYLFVFVALFLLNQLPATNAFVSESAFASTITSSSPILSDITSSYYDAFEEILSIKDQNMADKEEYNRKCLDILLKYGILDINSAEDLLDRGKLVIPNADSILDKYKKKKKIMIKYLKEENFENEIKNGKILVDFYADWCGPCKALGEILEQLKDVNVLKINVDEHQDLAIQFGVMSIPTIILFEDGKQKKKNIGLMSKDDLENWIK